VAMCLFSCKKDSQLQGVSLVKPHGPAVDSIALNIFVDGSKPGHTISPMFEGFSYETALLAQNPEYLNGQNHVLINIVKNLGWGVIRIGGNSSDMTNWAGDDADTSQKNVVTTAQIDRLADFSKATGWPVIFGLNLVNKNAGAAAQEADYVAKKLGRNLLALQNGNEPDVYRLGPRPRSYSFNDFHKEWSNYFKSVREVLPQAKFAGPDVTPFNNTWLSDFTTQEGDNINLVDGHYYATGPASNPNIRYTDILNDNKFLYGYLLTLNNVSAKTGKPYRISECNSVFGQGKPGVSNVFASALWALDFMWKVADNYGQGVNFHGGNTSFVYSPIAHPGNLFIAQPEYYAMLAFKYGAVGRAIVPVEMDNRGYNIGAHAVISHKGYAVTLINKELKTDAIFTISFNKQVENVSVARLASSSITSGNATFAGSQVNTDGTFNTNITETYTVNNLSSIKVRIPAASAAVITVN
jgi:hypothetical protein